MEFSEVPESLILKINRILNESEAPEVITPGQKAWKTAILEKSEREQGKEVLKEKDDKEEVEEAKGEKITFNPSIEPDKMAQPDKNQRTV